MNNPHVTANMARRLYQNKVEPIVNDIKRQDDRVVFTSCLILTAMAQLRQQFDSHEAFVKHVDQLINTAKEGAEQYQQEH